MDSLTIITKYFERGPIVSHKSVMDNLLEVNSIWSSVVRNDLENLQNYSEKFILPLKHHTMLLQVELLPRETKRKPVTRRLIQQRHHYLTCELC